MISFTIKIYNNNLWINCRMDNSNLYPSMDTCDLNIVNIVK